jgi:UDP-N-acetylglucosamine acyltransferase
MSKSLSYIHPDAKIGKNVVIDSFVTIDKDVIIGEGTWIGPNATKIFPGAVISAPPQDLKFSGEYSTVEIGNNTTIREFVTINRGTVSKEKTVIGDNTLLMAYVHIAHDCIIGNHCIIVNSVNVAGEVEIGDWAIIGGTSAIHQFVKIGAHVMISGGSLVRKDVPPFIMAGKDPLCYAGINSIGLRRRKFSNDIIYQIQDIYREIYQKNQNNTQAIEKINKNFPQSSERDEIVNFIKNSERGIIRG